MRRRTFIARVSRRSMAYAAACIATSLGFTVAKVGAQEQQHTGGDPLGSMQWPILQKKYIGADPMEFNSSILLQTPLFAEDAMNVPIMVDARPLQNVGGGIAQILLLADRNPVQPIARLRPLRVLPVLALRFKLQQGSPLRALVQTKDGVWHVGSRFIEASGGGCTVPGLSRADGSWSRTLNQVQAKFFKNILSSNLEGQRLRLRIMHPMDTGLAPGIPAFYIESLRLHDEQGQVWAELELHEPVSENPILTLEFAKPSAQDSPLNTLVLEGRDNAGNRIYSDLR